MSKTKIHEYPQYTFEKSWNDSHISKTKTTNATLTQTIIKLKQVHVINNIGKVYFKRFYLLVNRKKYKNYNYLKYIKGWLQSIVNTLSFSLITYILSINSVQAGNNNYNNVSYCNSRKLGWHFYCEEPKTKKQKDKEDNKDIKPQLQKLTPQQELKQIREELETRKALAVLYPTQENIKNYIIYQREQLDRSSVFAQQWQRTIWSNPSIDYSLVRPTSSVGSKAWTDNHILKEKQALKELNLNKRYGIFFIYKSTCPYCHSYSPIIKDFSKQYNLSIIPITLDGIKLKEFPNSLTEKGQLEKLGIQNTKVPATLLYDNQEKRLIPIGYGVLTQDELISRILSLTKIEVGSDL